MLFRFIPIKYEMFSSFHDLSIPKLHPADVSPILLYFVKENCSDHHRKQQIRLCSEPEWPTTQPPLSKISIGLFETILRLNEMAGHFSRSCFITEFHVTEVCNFAKIDCFGCFESCSLLILVTDQHREVPMDVL